MPNHALHWAAIQWAKAKGCVSYVLWGVPESVGEASEEAELALSLYQFKQGFGGKVVKYTGAWDVVFSEVKYRMYQKARSMRKGGLV